MDIPAWPIKISKRSGAGLWLLTLAATALCVPVTSTVRAEELPPVSARMLGKAALACIMITDSGNIGGAYLLSTSGDEAADRDMLAWVKRLHWDPAKPGEKMRNVWFATGVAFGDAKAPTASATCNPPESPPAAAKP